MNTIPDRHLDLTDRTDSNLEKGVWVSDSNNKLSELKFKEVDILPYYYNTWDSRDKSRNLRISVIDRVSFGSFSQSLIDNGIDKWV